MRPSLLSLSLAAAMVSAALLAACGESNPQPQVPPSPGTTSAPVSTPPPATTPPPTTAKPPDTAPPATTSKPPDGPPAGNLLRPIKASEMAGDLKEAGFDINKLVPFSKMKTAEKSKVMKSISKATGLACKECHVEGDYKKDTPHKMIARHMWDEYVVPHKLADGPVFCDSCHQGSEHILDRKNKDATNAFMDANFVKKLTRKDNKGMACNSCHGPDGLEFKIFQNIWKVPADKAEAPGEPSPNRVAHR